MKFGFVTVQIGDMERSLAFYHQLLGLPILRRNAFPGGELAFLGTEGQPTIELITNQGEEKPPYSGFSIGIEVPSLDEATALLAEHGHPVIRGPISPNPAVRFSFVHDPDGIEIELIEYL